MPFWEGTVAEQNALKAVASLYTQNQLLTTAQLQSQLQQNNASWASQFNITEIQIDGAGGITVARSAKIHVYRVAPDALSPTGTLISIAEGNTFYDGDVLYLTVKENHVVTVLLPKVSVKLKEAGHFLKLIRVYGEWQPETMNPDVKLPFYGYTDTVTVLGTDTELTVTHQILKVSAVTAPTPSSAVYEITAIAGTGDIILLYVDAVLIAEGNIDTSIDNMGVDLETKINAGTDFTAVYNAGTNQLTISDANNLGAAGDSMLLSSQELNGAAGTIVSQFTGGVNGVASNVTIDTINGLVENNSYQIHNAMAANTVTLTGVGGNLVGSVLPLVLAAGDWAWVSCVNPSEGRVK